MTSMLVKEVMIVQPPYIRCGASLDDVVETLLRHRVLGMPVVDEDHRVIGFVSEQDCIHTMLVSSYHHEGSPKVDDVMHGEVLTVDPETSIIDIAQRMGKDKPKSYPVTKDGKLVGLVTRSAILKALWEHHISDGFSAGGRSGSARH